MFTSYEKIPESPRQWGLDEAGERALAKVAWVVTEKIHGANFCLVSDGQRVQCANRKNLLAPDEEFFGYQRLLARLEGPALLAFALVRRTVPQARSVAIYGELFGGAYPHPDVPPDPLAQPVQTGVYYAPSIEFCAFDIAVEGPAGRVYLDDAPMRAVCREAGIFAAEPLLTGPYSAALDYPVGFDSTVPRRLGLPPLAEPNRAEGVVIKPAQALLLPGARGPLRPVLKKKIAEFAEDQRYSGAQKWSTPRVAAPDSLDELRWAAFNMVTQNRLRNAVSKIGPGRRGDGRHTQRLFRLLRDDILEQLSEEQGAALAALGPAQRQQLTLFIETELRTLLRDSSQKDQ
ncbi:MAG TPA: RNA ligase family protein [Roseiflexaceae bacterium]|nr:RNA ligase family protein [Roseiflexaceae bacterium]